MSLDVQLHVNRNIRGKKGTFLVILFIFNNELMRLKLPNGNVEVLEIQKDAEICGVEPQNLKIQKRKVFLCLRYSLLLQCYHCDICCCWLWYFSFILCCSFSFIFFLVISRLIAKTHKTEQVPHLFKFSIKLDNSGDPCLATLQDCYSPVISYALASLTRWMMVSIDLLL